jgi:hypothetical protein
MLFNFFLLSKLFFYVDLKKVIYSLYSRGVVRNPSKNMLKMMHGEEIVSADHRDGSHSGLSIACCFISGLGEMVSGVSKSVLGECYS